MLRRCIVNATIDSMHGLLDIGYIDEWMHG